MSHRAYSKGKLYTTAATATDRKQMCALGLPKLAPVHVHTAQVSVIYDLELVRFTVLSYQCVLISQDCLSSVPEERDADKFCRGCACMHMLGHSECSIHMKRAFASRFCRR